MGMLGGQGGQCRLLMGLAWLLLATGNLAQAAESCRAVYSGGLQTHGNGSVVFQWGGTLRNNPSLSIDTVRVQSPWGAPSCGKRDCQASGLEAADFAGLMLPAIKGENDLKLGYLGVGEAGGSDLNRYRTISVDAGATLTFNPRHQAYYIQRLSIGYGAKVTLAPGRYWIDQLDMASNSQLLIGGGNARVMVGSSLNLPYQASLNGEGSAEALQLFVRGNLNLESSATVAALAYVEGDYRGAFASRLRGGLNARKVVVDTAARIETRMDAIAALGWNNQCSERTDLDGDGVLDLLDDDTDGDGYDDEAERLAGSDPRNPQSVPKMVPPSVRPSQCTAAFARGLQSHTVGGRIRFGLNAQLRDGVSAYLPASQVDNSFASFIRSCGTQDCQPSYTPAPAPQLPVFLKTGSNFNQNLGYGTTQIMDGSRSDWRRLKVAGMATARFTKPGVYRLREVEVGYRGTLELSAGDYWIEKLTLASESRIVPVGAGTVRLHVAQSLELPWLARFNAEASGQARDPSQLLVLAEGNVVLGSNTMVSGFVYARGNLTQQYASQLIGGAVAANLSLETQALARQDLAALGKLDFGLLCDLDGDGIGDNLDPDRDGDDISNDYEIQLGYDPDDKTSTPPDMDKDRIPDALDDDIDGDGVPNDKDAFPYDKTESKDLDKDGIGDNADTDRDGDGVDNDKDAFPDDPKESSDLDRDKIGDNADTDRDGDGVDNDKDAFPDDPKESSDLDNDGTGDNADLDRDGDGFSNDDELAAGTNPNDPTSFPDRQPPVVSIDGPEVINANEDSITLSGTASDSASGLARLEFTSDRFPGTRFAVTLQGSQWSASVPLLEGTNRLTLTAFDKAGNHASLARSVEREPLANDIALTVDYPLPGATVKDASLVVRGQLRSDKAAQRMEVLVNGQPASVLATDQVTLFGFQSAPIALQSGANTLIIQAWVDQRSVQRSLMVTYQPPQTSFKAPRFDNLSPADGSLLPGNGFMLSGQVYAEAGLERISVAGRNLVLREPGAQLYDLREALSAPEGQSSYSIELLARDLGGQETRQTLSWTLDQEPPQITLDQPLVELPARNRVSEQPYPLKGTLREANLSSFQVNGSDVALEPGGQAGEFRFTSRIALPIGQPVSVTLEARDQAGNQLRREYSLELSAQAAIHWVFPTDGTELLNLGEPLSLQVAARIDDISGQLAPRAMLLTASGELVADALLTGNTTLKSATLQIPPQSGQYQLLAVLQAANGKVVAQSARTISLVTPQQVPVALERIEPANNARFVEPNGFISFYFNQAIDLSKLKIEVFETVHGKSYVDLDELGTSELKAQGYQLVRVDRDHQPVVGSLSELPGSQVIAFYPKQDLAYNAEVSVEVSYDGRELERMRYRTRPLPTFISGALLDQLQQPVANVEVRLEELGRSVRTNRDGAFNFGFGDSAEQTIPSGQYRLLLNPGAANRSFGADSLVVTIQGGERNDLGRLQLSQLNPSLPYFPVRGGTQLSLLDGELKLDLSNASLTFPDGRQDGDLHAQTLELGELPYPVEPLAMPYWMYSLQPAGVQVQGSMRVDLAALRLGGSLDYLPPDGTYVVMVGLDREAASIVPVGAGVIENGRIRSQGTLAQGNLDLFGFALADLDAQPVLKAYAEGQLNLRQLQAELYRLNKGR